MSTVNHKIELKLVDSPNPEVDTLTLKSSPSSTEKFLEVEVATEFKNGILTKFILANNDLTVDKNIVAKNDITAQNAVNALNIVAKNNVAAQNDIFVHHDVNVDNAVNALNIVAKNNVAAQNDIFVHHDVNVDNAVNALNIVAKNNVAAQNDIFVHHDVNVDNNIIVKGDITLAGPGGDCAEEFDLSSLENIESGTVMVINNKGYLEQSQQPYDKKVAGIVSGAGKYRPALILDKKENNKNKRIPIALIGKVYCKVDASNSSIEIGDLLTTSMTRGYAMKADDPYKAFGAVIGKALGSIKEGFGLIPVLVALQ